jgi:radical SAM protein with 4Fe4S-binding SPASM domain
LTPEEYYEFIKNVEELRKSCSVKIQTYFDVLGERSRWLENQTSLLNKRTCAAGVEACVISPEGYVYGCAASNPIEDGLSKKTNNFFIVGNINERSIMDIWLDSEKWRVYRSFNLNKSKRCLKCNFYTKKCFGNCFVSSFFDSGKLNSDDPYCFAHLLKNSGVEKNG